MLALPPALAPLAQRDQFVCWWAWPVEGKPGKMHKYPCRWDGLGKDGRASGEVTDAQDPANWTSAVVAMANASKWDRGHGAGVGYVFTDADPYAFIDIDSCLEPAEDGRPAAWSLLAQELMARLPGAAVEVSQSGKGLHLFGRYSRLPPHAKKNTPLGLELYTGGRFVALTGTYAAGSIDTDITDALELIIAAYFVPSVTGDFAGWTAEPIEGWDGPTDDDDLIAKAMRSGKKSAAAVFGDGGAVTFQDLWEANAAKLAQTWPGEGFKPFGQSEADLALADHLAYWTGKNCERMETLMRRSALARDKWDSHRTYLAGTIMKACAFTRTVAQGRPDPAIPATPQVDPEVLAATARTADRALRTGLEYLGPQEQVAHFAGCTYVVKRGEIYSVEVNDMLPRSPFDVIFGGHLFTMDPTGQKTTASAWEAFTLSRVWKPPTAYDICFKPTLGPGALVTEGGRTLVNSYVPYDCPTAEGDPAPFLDLLARMLPNPGDQRIMVNFMAALAQNPGIKFQWWPVIQGVQGNGKTMLGDFLTYVLGEHYTHKPDAAAMIKNGLQFNSWIDRKLLIIVEEINSAGKRDFLDQFKVVVTNRRMAFEGKGANQIMGDNAANGLLLTNYRDGVPVTADERRYPVFYCAQQRAEDLARDGMDGEYFPNLLKWIAAGGYAIVANFLKTFAVEEAFNPVTMTRAPQTSSSLAAVANSLGAVEQEILEAISEGRVGFAGGWVSSIFLDRLIKDMRRTVPRSQRKDMMHALGYGYHQALDDGRVNNVVTPDGGKPRLFLRTGHLAHNLLTPAEVAKAYSKAQEPGVDHSTADAARAFGS